MGVAGYNIAFKLDDATLAGRTQDDITIAARTSERLTKDDEGDTQVSVIGQDITFRCTGLVVVSAEELEEMAHRDNMIQMILNSSSIAFTYIMPGGRTLSGNVVPVNYGESSNASDDATWTMDFRVVGTPTLSQELAPISDSQINPGSVNTEYPGGPTSGGSGIVNNP